MPQIGDPCQPFDEIPFFNARMKPIAIMGILPGVAGILHGKLKNLVRAGKTGTMQRMMRGPSEKQLWWLVGGLFLALLLAVAWKMWPSWFPPRLAVASPPRDCNLHRESCRAGFPDGAWVELSITPRPVEPLKPLTLRVRVEGIRPEQVEVDFSGVEMYMGYNRASLRPGEGSGEFVGRAVLPVCTWSRMTWRAEVLLRAPQGVHVAPFEFETRGNS